MKVAVIQSYCMSSREVLPVTVEVVIRQGLPSVEVSGNVGKSSLEGVKRLETSLRASGYTWPKGRVYISISPTQHQKEVNSLDLAVAVAILVADRQIVVPKEVVVLGEVSLTGEVRAFQNSEAILRRASHTGDRCLLPELMEDTCDSVANLTYTPIQAISQLRGISYTEYSQRGSVSRQQQQETFMVDRIIGQKVAKRVLSISLAGKIPLLITGPSGVGKTLLVRSGGELLPKLSEKEYMGMFEAYTRAGLVLPGTSTRSVVTPNLGSNPKELFRKLGLQLGGYISLAAWGVLFLDELPERGKEVVDTLRQVLETPINNRGYSSIVIAAQNTCYCGRFGSSGGMCTCTPADLAKYQRTFSEAIYQRFPLSIYMSLPKPSDYGESGRNLACGIERVWSEGRSYRFSEEADRYLAHVVNTEKLAPRTQANLKRVSEVIAALENTEYVEVSAVEEALTYRYRPTVL